MKFYIKDIVLKLLKLLCNSDITYKGNCGNYKNNKKKTLNIKIELMTIFVRQKTWLNWYKPYFPNIDKKYIHIQVTWIETNLCHI